MLTMFEDYGGTMKYLGTLPVFVFFHFPNGTGQFYVLFVYLGMFFFVFHGTGQFYVLFVYLGMFVFCFRFPDGTGQFYVLFVYLLIIKKKGWRWKKH